jgi:hypothetical protein
MVDLQSPCVLVIERTLDYFFFSWLQSPILINPTSRTLSGILLTAIIWLRSLIVVLIIVSSIFDQVVEKL